MCGGKMKKLSKFNAGMALGSLTAAVALLAGTPVASAQTTAGASDDTSVSGQAAPGGGSFPGSFLVPGTNTSIKIGGFAKGVYIFDASAADGAGVDADVVAAGAIPLDGSAAHQLHGATRIHARQSNFSFDVRTPTAWGELDTFILTDFFGQNTAQAMGGSNTQNARLVLAYGTLGPVLVGQGLTLFFDGQAIGETVDPTASIGVNNGLTNRQPQFRYTWVGAGGLSVAASVEEPVWEVVANDGTSATAAGTGPAGAALIANAAAVGGGGFINRYPDFLARVQLDQSWGHVGLGGVVREQEPRGIGVHRFSDTGWGLILGGHLNTFGKDTLRGEAIVGKALGHYLSQFGATAGVEATSLVNGVGFASTAPLSYGMNISYTHWWTNELRSTAMAGYEHLDVNTAILSANATQNAVDKMHVGGTINLVWSPVPQVDFGVEYTHLHRVTAAPLTAAGGVIAVQSTGSLNRIEGMGVFKF
jgi:hypothetical protein